MLLLISIFLTVVNNNLELKKVFPAVVVHVLLCGDSDYATIFCEVDIYTNLLTD